jgi:hypothetical protein
MGGAHIVTDFLSRRGRRWIVSAMAFLLVSSAVATLPATPARAHGSVDQKLSGNPACNAVNFPGAVVSVTAQRQEFVPAQHGLAAVELCLNIIAGTDFVPFTVNIYEGGTATDPGPLKGSRTLSAPTGFDFVHVDFPSVLATTTGTRYIIEIPTIPEGVTFQWRQTCPGPLPCNSPAQDKYPQGTTNFSSTIGTAADFGFRSLPPNTADLTGALTGPSVVCPGQSIGSAIAASATNSGPTAVGSFSVGAYISSDATITTEDQPLTLGHRTVPSLGASSTVAVPFTGAAVPSAAATGRSYLGILVDEFNTVAESNEANNFAAIPITITVCQNSDILNLALTPIESQVGAGVFDVPVSSIPASAIPSDATPPSIPLHTSPLHTSPLFTSPLHTSPLFTSPLFTSFLGAPASVLDSITLAQIPFTDASIIAEGGWRKFLAGTAEASTPLQDVTLRRALQVIPPGQPTLGQVALERTPLRLITATSLATGATPLNGTPLQGGEDWCAHLDSIGFNCAANGIDPATTNLLYLNLLGVPFRLISLAPFSADSIRPDAPLNTALLRNDPSGFSYRVRQTPLRNVMINDLTDASIVNCSLLDDPCGEQTLSEADVRGAFANGVNFKRLRDSLPASAFGAMTLGDAVIGLLAPDSIPWESLAVDRLDAPLFASNGEVIHTHVTFLAGAGAPVVDPIVTVKLPADFLFGGNAQFRIYPEGSPGGSFSPVAGAAAGQDVRIPVSALVDPGNVFELTLDVLPELTLGVFSFPNVAVQTTDFSHTYTRSAANQGSVRVVDIETTLPNDDGVTSPILTPGSLVFSHISSATDVDRFRIAVPPAPGTRLTVTLSHIPLSPVGTDFDLLQFAPTTSPLFTSPLHTSPLFTSPLFTSDYETTTTDQQAPPESLQDIPLFTSPLHTSSINRSSADERVSFTSVAGEGGSYVIQVSGYNGSNSPFAYMLHVTETPPPALGPCTTRRSTYTGGGLPGTTLPTLGSSTNTVFLWNQKLFGDIYGAQAASEVGSALGSLAARTDLGINGAVVAVEADPAVAQAYADWNSAACDPVAANRVVSAVVQLLANLTAGSNVTNVVLVGNDEALPFVRIPDSTTKGNEQDFALEVLRLQGNTPITGSAAGGFFLSDDIYANTAPVSWADHQYYRQDRSVGRLVESPADILFTINQFIASGGAAVPQSATVTGYDFLTDGATAIADTLAARIGSQNVKRFISESWTRNDVLNDLDVDVLALNGHADQYRLLPGAGNTSGDDSDLLTSADVPPGVPPVRTALSVACHLGLSIPDSLSADPSDPAVRDWAQTRNAVLVANSGFGYGDDTFVGYSEALMASFMEHLQAGVPAGEALRLAKREMFDQAAVYDAFYEKFIQQAIFYGLPQFRSLGAGAPPAGPSSLGSLVSSGSPQSSALSFGPVSFADRAVPGLGTITTANGQDPVAVHRYPIGPKVSVPLTVPAGQEAHGVLITGLTSTDRVGYNPVFAGVKIEDGSEDGGELQAQTVSFPTDPAPRISTAPDGSPVLLWLPFQFRSTGKVGGQVVGNFRQDSSFTGLLGTAPAGSPFTPPRIAQVQHSANAADSQVTFTVKVAGATRVLALWRTTAGAAWNSGDLLLGGANTWVSTFAKPAGASITDILIQATDQYWNVGRWTFKGDLLPAQSQQPPVGFSINVSCATPGGAGWCRSDAVVTISGDPGVSFVYRLDGSDLTPYTGGVTISETGTHTFFAQGSDGNQGSIQVLVDKLAPTIEITSPEAKTYQVGDVVQPAYACQDAGSGTKTCSGPATVDTSTAGTKQYTVTAEDFAGNTSSQTVTYTVSGFRLEGPFDPLKPVPFLNKQTAGNTAPIKFRVFRPDGTEVTDTAVLKSVTSQKMSCTSPFGGLSAFVAAVSNPPFRYSSGFFIFNMVTDKAWANTCRRVVVTLTDLTSMEIYLKLVK